MSAFTPGPWKVWYTAAGPRVKTESNQLLARVTGGEVGQWDANAALIAAAPELLYALKEAVIDINSLCDVLETVPGCKPKAFRKGAEIYLAAIAKAEGRS